MDVVADLGLDVTLKNGELTARQLDTIGQKGDAAAKTLISGFSKFEIELMKTMQDIQQMQRQLDNATAAASRMSAPAVSFRREIDQTNTAVTRMTAPAVSGFRQLEDAQNGAAKAAGVHGLNLGRVNMELGTAIGRFAGINPAITRFSAMLGGSLAGYGQAIALIGAVLALVEAYKAWGVEADDAKAKQNDLTKSLLDWYDAQRNAGTFELRREIEATTKSVLELQAQLDKLNQGKVGGLGVIGQAPGGVFSSILRIASAGNLGQMISQFATEIGKGSAKISESIATDNQAIDAATKRLEEMLNQNRIAVEKQTALNDAFIGGAYALGLINLAYEHQAALAKNKIDYDSAHLDQANKLTDALYAQQVRAAGLTEQQRALNEQIEKSEAFWEKEKSALEKTVPQFTINAQWYQRIIDELAVLNAAHEGEIQKIGKENAERSKATVNQIAEQIKQSNKYKDDLAKIWRDGIAKITTDGFKSFQDFAEDLNQLFTKIMDRMAERARQLGKTAGGAGYTALGLGVAGLSGFSSGYSSGSATTGIIGGALAGSAFGPVGVAVGALAGLTGGLLGGAKAAKERRDAENQLRDSLTQSLTSIRVQMGQLPEIAGQIAQAEAQFAARAKQINDAYAGKKNEAEREALLGANSKLEQEYIEWLKKQDEATKAATKAAEEAAAAQQALADAQKNASAQGNYQLRFLNATGQSDAAFALQQQQEIEDAITQGLDAISLRLLENAQAAEKAQREQEKQTALLQDQLSTAQQAYDSLKQVYDSLSQFSDSLKIGQYSPLSPRQQLDASRGQLNALYQAALGGDQNAASQFGGVAQSFLDASRKYNASGAGYVLDYNSVNVMTEALKSKFGAQMSDAQKQVSLLQQQLDVLKSIDTNTILIAQRPLTPEVPTPVPVGSPARPRIEASADVVDAITILTDRVDGLVAVSQAAANGTIAATNAVLEAVEENTTLTTRKLDSLTAATSRMTA